MKIRIVNYVSLHESIKALIASIRVLYLQNQIANILFLLIRFANKTMNYERSIDVKEVGRLILIAAIY